MQQNVSIMAVFDAVGAAGEISRSGLADATGFSLMTVGKAIDKLTACGVIAERKPTSGGVGRRSGMCSLVKANGMILLDLTDGIRARICDISLDILGEYTGDELCDVMAKCFCGLAEVGCAEIMGVGCVMPDGIQAERGRELCEMLGSAPEVLVGASRAWAFANSKRFEYSGMAAFVQMYSDGHIGGMLMQSDRPYTGSHGRAGDLVRLASRGNVCEKLSELCLALDPELIHIACENEAECASLEAELDVSLTEWGFDNMTRPSVVVEPLSICRGTLDGAALMLREKYVLTKIPNNT